MRKSGRAKARNESKPRVKVDRGKEEEKENQREPERLRERGGERGREGERGRGRERDDGGRENRTEGALETELCVLLNAGHKLPVFCFRGTMRELIQSERRAGVEWSRLPFRLV